MIKEMREWEIMSFDAVVKASGALAVANGVLFVTAFGSLSNSCSRPNLVYYYTGTMSVTAFYAVTLCLVCGFSFYIKMWLEQRDYPKDFPKMSWREIIYHFITFAIFVSLSAFLFSGLEDFVFRIGDFPMRRVPNSISVEEFCKSGGD